MEAAVAPINWTYQPTATNRSTHVFDKEADPFCGRSRLSPCHNFGDPMNRKTTRLITAMLALLTASLLQPSYAKALGYTIEQNTLYTSYGCEMLANTDIPDDTASLKTALDSAGWSGYRYTDTPTNLAWPQDLWESCSTSIYGSGGWSTVIGGLDNYYGDARNLTVFSGHGGDGWMIWGHVNNGECTANLGVHTRVGEMGGGSANFGIWYACSVLQPSEMGSNMWQSLRQQAGFYGEDTDGVDEIRDFFNATVNKTNADAWLDQYVGRPAVIESFSRTSATDCWNTHNGNKLKGNVGNTVLGGAASCGQPQPWYVGCAEWN